MRIMEGSCEHYTLYKLHSVAQVLFLELYKNGYLLEEPGPINANFLLPSYYQMASEGADINGGLAAIHWDLLCLTILIQGRNPTVFFFTSYFITWAKLEVIRPTEVSWEVYTSVGLRN